MLDSNEYPQHMFLWRNKQNYPLIIIQDLIQEEVTLATVKFQKFQTHEKSAVMRPKDADGMVNSVDPDQTAPLGACQTSN